VSTGGLELGLVYPQTELRGDPDAVRRIGAFTEGSAFDYLLAYDHVVGAEHADREPKLWGPYTERDPFHDPFVLFAYLAGRTERIGLATGVLILPQRQTVLVAKQAADLDLLCGGRLRLGVGTGWNYVEYDALGQDFAARGARLDEQVPYLRRLWTESLVSMEGRFDRIERGNVLPRPTRSIPIWMGGFSEPAFRRGAQLGDGFNFAGDPSRVADGVARVRHHRQAAGRSMEGYGLDLTLLRVSDLDAVAAAADAWRALGGTHLSVSSMWLGLESSVEAHLDFFGRVIDRLTAG
jgi:probable F420-dependent oxidoreductase